MNLTNEFWKKSPYYLAHRAMKEANVNNHYTIVIPRYLDAGDTGMDDAEKAKSDIERTLRPERLYEGRFRF